MIWRVSCSCLGGVAGVIQFRAAMIAGYTGDMDHNDFIRNALERAVESTRHEPSGICDYVAGKPIHYFVGKTTAQIATTVGADALADVLAALKARGLEPVS